jgi:dihydroxyacetone kinase-like protein
VALGNANDTVGNTFLTAWLREFDRLTTENAQYLTDLDAAVGDADHGLNMDRGMKAVVAKLDDGVPADPAALCKLAATTLISSVGGAAGPLYGTLFLRMGPALGPDTAADATTFAAALRAGVDGVVARGRAEPGDKTMIDALTPAVDALDAALAAGAGLPEALRRAADAAAAGRDATLPLVARKGRASYLGERSAGHLDPGAASSAMLIAAAATAAAGPAA